MFTILEDLPFGFINTVDESILGIKKFNMLDNEISYFIIISTFLAVFVAVASYSNNYISHTVMFEDDAPIETQEESEEPEEYSAHEETDEESRFVIFRRFNPTQKEWAHILRFQRYSKGSNIYSLQYYLKRNKICDRTKNKAGFNSYNRHLRKNQLAKAIPYDSRIRWIMKQINASR